MKILIMTLLLMATSVKANELQELQLPMMCGPSDNLLEGLRERYEEEIVFMAPSENKQGQQLTHSLWINFETTTWSFVAVNRDLEMLCIIASGDNGWTELFRGKSI